MKPRPEQIKRFNKTFVITGLGGDIDTVGWTQTETVPGTFNIVLQHDLLRVPDITVFEEDGSDIKQVFPDEVIHGTDLISGLDMISADDLQAHFVQSTVVLKTSSALVGRIICE